MTKQCFHFDSEDIFSIVNSKSIKMKEDQKNLGKNTEKEIIKQFDDIRKIDAIFGRKSYVVINDFRMKSSTRNR